ncbi:hypothetical protein Back11_37480 [Paenibacillus baekrokdamisoli]|uniref:Right handed beta helix domain-containing protein n=1 Tax=Paenibacillus baekrokdamisoli TaxID=1712516 RepID=A0A3G9JBU9_9BACL|nr:right-handed parallel beta-helix repeat-containing protein [Paenibacillus baekrokdamisoli]MBB3072545.1 hypothetical protein [Paenibacillus baekrokdamisoli]BBH22403.1 hypothetical protein Back11_37480 [Paenibacillus baekrokdamisoli]
MEDLNFNEASSSVMDIQIDSPVWKEYKKVSVTDFGAKAEEGCCNEAAFQRAIDYCKQERVAELTVPRGVYPFLNGNHPVFDGLRDFRFNGGGSEFIFSTVSAYFTIRHCERAIFQDFIVDWDWETGQLASIGQVQAIAEDGSSFDLCFPEYDLVPEALAIRTMNAMNPRTLTPGCELGREINGNLFGKISVMSNNIVRVELPRHESFHFLKQGQTYIVRHYIYDANAFELHGNQHLRMANVTIYSAPGHAFVTTGDQHHWALEHCRIIKRPGTTRCISVTADGCHVSNSQGYFIIENCDFSYNGDDCLNIHDNSVQGFERFNETTIRLSRVQGWRNPFGSGDPIEFRNTDLSPAGITVSIASVLWDERNQHCTIEFESPLPSGLSNQSILFNRRYNSSNYIVRNNFFHQNRARGILLHSGNGLVENNHFYMNQGSAIQIECGAEARWAEGFGVENVLIRNNLIENSDVNHWNMAVIYMGVYLEQGRTCYPVFNEIRIEHNTILNCPQQAIYASSCRRVFIRDNAIMNSNAGAVKTDSDGDENCVPNRDYYQGSLMVSHCRDIFIENNRRLATIPTTADHIYIEPDTSTNVSLSNNTGFERKEAGEVNTWQQAR